MSSFFTPNRHCYSVRFSTFDPNHLAVACSQLYGYVGAGTLLFLEILPNGALIEKRTCSWADGLFDVAWSELDSKVVITASGDGSLQLWDADFMQKESTCRKAFPKACYLEHEKEVSSVDCCKTFHSQLFLSGSWDSSIKLWDLHFTKSLFTYQDHSDMIYGVKFAEKKSNLFASVSADGYLKLWDVLDCKAHNSIKAHMDAEILALDWCKFDENILATGGSDGLIRGWDLRNLSSHIFELYGCSYAVRRIQFSSHSASIIASVAYDSTTRIWDFEENSEPIETAKNHLDFSYGLDWNRFKRGQLADCGWDSIVHVFTPNCLA